MIYKIYFFLKKTGLYKKSKYISNVYNLIYKILILFILKKEKIVKFYNLKLFINLNDLLVSRRIYLYKHFHKEIEDYIIKNIKKNSIVFDVGANIGIYSLLMSDLVGKGGRVISFEPEERNIELFKKSIKINNLKNIKLHECLLSNKRSNEFFYIDHDYYGSSSILKQDLSSKKYKKIILETNTFDNIVFNKYEKVNFIKCNIDGSEYKFLEGAIKTIKKFKPEILLEFNIKRFEKNKNFNFENFFNFYRSLGYSIIPLGFQKKFSNDQLKELTKSSENLYLHIIR
jgi:FkbM family methyltransferase